MTQADLHEPPRRRRASTGIRTFEDVVQRCNVDDETGCLVWALSCTPKGVPVAHIAAGVFADGKVSMTARRAAWLLSGRRVRKGQDVYLAPCCTNMLCCLPEHCATGPRGANLRAAAKRGVFSTPERRAQLRAFRMRQVIPEATVRAAAAAIAAGMTAKDAAIEFGMHKETAQRIRRGAHVHQQPRLLPGASVFAQGDTPARVRLNPSRGPGRPRNE